MAKQQTFFDNDLFRIDKPIRLITLFSGYDSQALALKYLGVPFEHYRTCEWSVKSIQALRDLHFNSDTVDYAKELTQAELVQWLADKGVVGCQTTDGSSPKHNNRVAYNYRIRKLTERECFRLMGVRDKDFDKIKTNQSKSSLYHLAGDSIVTTCLMAIFGALTGADY